MQGRWAQHDPTRLLVFFESVDKESPGSCATVEATVPLQQCLCQFLSLMAQIRFEFEVPLKVLALRNLLCFNQFSIIYIYIFILFAFSCKKPSSDL